MQILLFSGCYPILYSKRGIAGRLLNMAVEDLRTKGISSACLVTNHMGFYERYGWEFFCMAQCHDEPAPVFYSGGKMQFDSSLLCKTKKGRLRRSRTGSRRR